jgi:hypothetical protein
MRIHLPVEHALELELAYFALEPLGLPGDVARSGLVVVTLGEIQQLTGVGDALRGAVDGGQLRGQPRTFSAQLLGARRIGPDTRILQLQAYLLQAFLLAVVLKETPSRSGGVLPGP